LEKTVSRQGAELGGGSAGMGMEPDLNLADLRGEGLVSGLGAIDSMALPPSLSHLHPQLETGGHFDSVKDLWENKEHWGIIVSREHPLKVLIRHTADLLKDNQAEDLKNQLRYL